MTTLCKENSLICKKGAHLGKISWACKFFLPFLILVTPFLYFLNYNAYCFTCPESLVIVSSLALIALTCSLVFISGWNKLYIFLLATLITIFIDLQFKWLDNIFETMGSLLFFSFLAWGLKDNFSIIATSVFGTFFAVTFALSGPFHADKTFPTFKPAPVSHTTPLPRLIHIILDEHIGIDGIPTRINGGTALQEKLIEFYRLYGFKLFTGAFSHYFLTNYSIPSLMNFSNDREQESNIKLDHRKGENHKLLHNTYFENLAKAGYQINVLAPQYIDYCKHSQIAIKNCFKYNSFKMNALVDLDIPVSQKVNLLLSRYLKKLYLKDNLIKKAYLFVQISGTHILGFSLPPWSWESSPSSLRMHSIHTMNVINNLGDRILAIPQGNVLFTHLLFPHYPYISNADCSIKNPMAWEDKTNRTGRNTPESREVRYQLYFDQVSCLYSKLDEIFKQMKKAQIYDNSIIILHGDHGSRISIRDPLVSNQDVLTEEDITDHFSTVFAVKMPGKTWGYDASPQPLEQLMANVATEITGISQPFGQNRPAKFVYLEDKKNKNRLIPIHYPMTH